LGVDRLFEFDFDRRFRLIALIYGATEKRSEVRITGDGRLTARFGFVRIDTPLSNVATAEKTGPYRWWKAIGVRTSLADKGLTFGSTAAGGVCIRFREAIGSKPRLFVRHPGLTLTVKDREGFIEALSP
jgi:hypothetical protein